MPNFKLKKQQTEVFKVDTESGDESSVNSEQIQYLTKILNEGAKDSKNAGNIFKGAGTSGTNKI